MRQKIRKSQLYKTSSLWILVCALVIAGTPAVLFAESFEEFVRMGNEAYQRGDYQEALDFYQKAEIEKPQSPGNEYNKAGARVKLGDFERALEGYQKSLLSDNVSWVRDAHFNMGNLAYIQDDYKSAIEQYQQAVELDPTDLDAKYNLELARKKLKERMKPQENENKDKEEKEQEQQENQDQEENQDQQEREQKDRGGDEENEEEKNQQQDQSQDSTTSDSIRNQQNQQPDPQKMSQEDAERLLNSLKDEEAKHQKKKRMVRAASSYSGRDW